MPQNTKRHPLRAENDPSPYRARRVISSRRECVSRSGRDLQDTRGSPAYLRAANVFTRLRERGSREDVPALTCSRVQGKRKPTPPTPKGMPSNATHLTDPTPSHSTPLRRSTPHSAPLPPLSCPLKHLARHSTAIHKKY